MRLKQRSDTNHCSFYKYHEDAVRITDWSCWRDVNRDQKEGVVPAGGAAGLERWMGRGLVGFEPCFEDEPPGFADEVDGAREKSLRVLA